MTPLDILRMVVAKMEDLGIPYMVGGSFASSLYGFARSTQDADLIIILRSDQAAPLCDALKGQFYVDRGSIEQALRAHSSFNVIHVESSFKVDFFILPQDDFAQQRFSRRAPETLEGESNLRAYIQSPEDTVLVKLAWFRQGGEVSENQWRDVLGIFKVRGGQLDLQYLTPWAHKLGIADLLERARGEAALIS